LSAPKDIARLRALIALSSTRLSRPLHRVATGRRKIEATQHRPRLLGAVLDQPARERDRRERGCIEEALDEIIFYVARAEKRRPELAKRLRAALQPNDERFVNMVRTPLQG
jgi:hypothetical protein